MTVREMQDEILRIKKEKDICILAHAYQRQDILDVADFVGDSFALSLAPYLALHYDIEFVRLGDWSDVFAANGAPDCDRVLVVWNFENLITTTDLSRTRSLPKFYGA